MQTFGAAGSRASRFRWPALAEEPRIGGIFGPIGSGPFAQLSRDGSSWRTFQLCFRPGGGGSLETFSGTWPRAGMMQSGTAFQLRPLAPITKGIGCGSYPTPDAGVSTQFNRSPSPGAKKRPNLAAMAKHNAWPTPTVGDSKSARNATAVRSKVPPTGIHAGMTLTDAVTVWPTPKGSPSGPDFARINRLKSGGDDLATAVARRNVPTPDANCWKGGERQRQLSVGQLNPTWVEWLMGFPLGWTALDASETPSSRRSRNGSDAGSAKSKEKNVKNSAGRNHGN